MLRIVLITGLSGAGRSSALRVLEDLSFFCVDNLPPPLILDLVDLIAKEGRVSALGLGIDIRAGDFLEKIVTPLQELGAQGYQVEIIYLDCSTEILLRRFSETRRPHMLEEDGNLQEAIERERQNMTVLRAKADMLLDTSRMSIHDLRRSIAEYVARSTPTDSSMVVRVMSFGFKYGPPLNADLVFDLRALPNPHFVPALRPLTGKDTRVAKYVLQEESTQLFVTDVETFLSHQLPNYEREGRAYLTIAFGCTGGKHRSVALAEHFGAKLGLEQSRIVHRDIGRS